MLAFACVFWTTVLSVELWAGLQKDSELDSHHWTISAAIASPPQQWFAIAMFIVIAALLFSAFVLLFRVEYRTTVPTMVLASLSSVLFIAVPCVSLHYSTQAHFLVAGALFLTTLALAISIEVSKKFHKRFQKPRRVVLAFYVASFISLLVSASMSDAFSSKDEPSKAASLATSISEFLFAIFFTLYIFLAFT